MEKRVKVKEVRFRLPDALYLRLKKIAQQNKRSITTQAEWYIEKALEAEEKLINIEKNQEERGATGQAEGA